MSGTAHRAFQAPQMLELLAQTLLALSTRSVDSALVARTNHSTVVSPANTAPWRLVRTRTLTRYVCSNCIVWVSRSSVRANCFHGRVVIDAFYCYAAYVGGAVGSSSVSRGRASVQAVVRVWKWILPVRSVTCFVTLQCMFMVKVPTTAAHVAAPLLLSMYPAFPPRCVRVMETLGCAASLVQPTETATGTCLSSVDRRVAWCSPHSSSTQTAAASYPPDSPTTRMAQLC
jgi:hypothetical protein